MRSDKKVEVPAPTHVTWRNASYLSVPREVTLTEIAMELITRAKQWIDSGSDAAGVMPDCEDRLFVGHHSILRHYLLESAGNAGLVLTESLDWSYTFKRTHTPSA